MFGPAHAEGATGPDIEMLLTTSIVYFRLYKYLRATRVREYIGLAG